VTGEVLPAPGAGQTTRDADGVWSVTLGDVRIVYFMAGSVGKICRMRIYFPPGYDAGRDRYPVL
jgi:hypothetical protein